MKSERFDIHQHITDQIIAAIEKGAGEFRLGDDAYAMEELVAELGAAFLCADLAITDAPRPDHAQYLDHWLTVMKADKKAIFTAASKASEAVTFLASLQGA
ncbi:MAG TPA: zincin-like metallopeptidase domain-containing protein [Methylocella sp.]